MAKKRPQTTKAAKPQVNDGEIPVVGAREPCPCGSGRRYKACHGRTAAHAVTELVQRPFEGLPGECDWVALRELVPAATVPLTLKDGLPEGVPSVTLATVLPMAWPALRRDDGSILLALQNDTSSGDLSRGLADSLQQALEAEPGTPVAARRVAADGPRLQDLLAADAPFEPVVHSGFEFWVPDAENAAAEVSASLERANAAAIPTALLSSVDAAYWCETPEKNHLRWVMPHPEEKLLDALARLHAAGDLLARRGNAAGRFVPGPRARRTGVGPAERDDRRGVREARGRVRRAARRGARLRGPADRGGAPGARRAHQPPSDAQLTVTNPGEPSVTRVTTGRSGR